MNTGARVYSSAVIILSFVGCAREPTFEAQRIAEDIRILSSDEFAGREPASAHEQKTVDHLVAGMKAAGLQPGGDALPNSTRAWTQDVPLLRTEITGPIELTVRDASGALQWMQGEEVAIRAAQTGVESVQLQNAPLVFVGFGVSAPERQWDDFKGFDLKGKIALILVNDPDFETGTGSFGGKAMTYYGRWTYKYEEAARRGAAGALVIHETEPAAYGWATVKNSNTGPMFDVRRANPLEQHSHLQGWIQRDSAALLMQKAGLDFDTLKAAAKTSEFEPVTLSGVSFSARYNVAKSEVTAKNVVGVVAGRTHPEEWIFYTSHHDHLGVGPADATGDTIYNGAVDNAAGTSQVLEIARAFAKAKRPQRSVGFLFVAAEEKGLLGSEYYASTPLYPLAKTVAILNSDAPRPTGAARDFTTAGDAPSSLQDMLIEIGKTLNRAYTPESRPEAGFFFRSDHFPFAKRGVPAISYKSGEDLIEGGVEAGKRWGEMYTRDRYHQPADEYDAAEWRNDGIVADAQLLYALGRRLADSRDWPEWKAGAEFKAARDATAAERKTP